MYISGDSSENNLIWNLSLCEVSKNGTDKFGTSLRVYSLMFTLYGK